MQVLMHSYCLFFRILYTCHHVLYKQLSAWMLHGLLVDHKGEFFIEKVDHAEQEEVTVAYLTMYLFACRA